MNDNYDSLTNEVIDLFNKNEIPVLIVSSTDPENENHIKTKFSGNLIQIVQLTSAAVMLLCDQITKNYGIDSEAAKKAAIEMISEQIKSSTTNG